MNMMHIFLAVIYSLLFTDMALIAFVGPIKAEVLPLPLPLYTLYL